MFSLPTFKFKNQKYKMPLKIFFKLKRQFQCSMKANQGRKAEGSGVCERKGRQKTETDTLRSQVLPLPTSDMTLYWGEEHNLAAPWKTNKNRWENSENKK